jgi:HEAT repeat protein
MDSLFNATSPIDKSIYNHEDQRQNLDTFVSSALDEDKPFVDTVKRQAESVACLIPHAYLKKGENRWYLSSKVPTLAQVVELEFQEKLGEQEAFCNEYVAGFGTAFLVGKQLVMTAAHCICKKDTDILDEKVIAATQLLFGFQKSSDYHFADKQVYQIKIVVSHQYIRIKDRFGNFTEWTDWALLELDREAPYTPLKMNMTSKIAEKVELYMLGHPYGLPIKFVDNGFVQRNQQKDFFSSNLDAFGGNSGSPVFNKATGDVEGLLCSGGVDWVITDDYRGNKQRRVQAHLITEKETGLHGFEICQRMTVLRFLLDDHLIGSDRITKPQNASELVIHSLKEWYRSQNKIPRLLHSALPIEEVYTELVLLQQSAEEKKEEKTALEEHRINSWEDVRGTKKPIELKDLFNCDGKEQKKLLILGGAGIGKSILCQYIAYQWSCGKLWPGKFDALFWVPLRKLQHAYTAETTASFLFRVCCQEYGPTLYSKDIIDYLEQNKERILFVLDGLDEVILEEDSPQKGIVDDLLAFPHWVLTSRPHAATSIQADAIIENVGFASKTIDLYIQKSFPENAQTVIQNIRRNPIILGLCHIPVNLELTCSILKDSKGGLSSIRSITGLYERLTLILQRRFLHKLGRVNAWAWEQEDIEGDADLSLAFKSLESVAWEGMKEKALFFSFNQGAMKKIYWSSYPISEAEKREPLFKTMCTSGFLQSTGESPSFLQNEYSFLHLTFQEFFAARYLVRLLKDNPQEAVKCIGEVKFNPRYKVVMWFTAGLLRKEGGDCVSLNAFFYTLDHPGDLRSLYGALLQMRCLEECDWNTQLKNLKSYQEEIYSWCEKIDLEISDDSIRRHLITTFQISPNSCEKILIPLLRLRTNYQDMNELAILEIADLLGTIGQVYPKSAIDLLIDMLKKNSPARYLYHGLVEIGRTHPQEVIPPLFNLLKSGHVEQQFELLFMLEEIGKIHPQEVIPPLFNLLKSGHVEQQFELLVILKVIGKTHPQIVTPFVIDILKSANPELQGAVLFTIRLTKEIELLLPIFIECRTIISRIDFKDRFRITIAEAFYQIDQKNLESKLPFFIDFLNDDNVNLKTAAIQSLGKLGQAHAHFSLPLLIKYLENEEENFYIKKIAAEALAQIGSPQIVFPLFIKNFRDLIRSIDIEGQLTRGVAKAFCQSSIENPESTIPLLIEVLKDESEDFYLRKLAAETLGKSGHNSSKDLLDLLAHTLEHPNEEIREASIKALGKLGHVDFQTVLPLAVKASHDKNEYVRKAATKALKRLSKIRVF